MRKSSKEIIDICEKEPFIRRKTIEEEKFVLEKNLIDAFQSKDIVKFRTLLNGFSHINKNESDMNIVFYEAILNIPRSDDFFGIFKNHFLITKENCKIILNTLMKLNFYSNFQKVIEINYGFNKPSETNDKIELIDKYVCEILKVESLKEIKKIDIQGPFSKNISENILKYLLDFGKFSSNYFDNYQRADLDSLVILLKDSSTKTLFRQLANSIVFDDEGRHFKKIFLEFLDEYRGFLPADYSFVVIADLNILLQIAFFYNYKPAVLTMLNCKKIDITQLKVKSEKNRPFSNVVARKGFHDLLEIFLEHGNKDQANEIFIIYTACLKGNIDEKKSDSKVGKVGVRNHDKCIESLIKSETFKEIVQCYNPMKQAVQYRNGYTALKLIQKFGLTSQFLEELRKSFLELFLNSCVSEERDGSAIKIDYSFLKDSKMKADWINFLRKLASNHEMNDLITHPVVSTFVELKQSRFVGVYVMNLILFLGLFVLPIWFNFFLNFPDGLKIASIFLFAREFIQYCFVLSSLGIKNAFHAFFRSIGNILEFLLLSSTIATFVCRNVHPYDKIFLITTILLGSVELSLLLTAVFSSLAIYVFILKTVIQTFLKMCSIIILYIISFAFCFHVIYNGANSNIPNNSTDSAATDEEDEALFNDSWFAIFVRTTIMLAGEINSSDMNFSTWWFTAALLLCFVITAFLMSNFITGLAIDDVQSLREKAEFYDLKLKVYAIERRESELNVLFSRRKYQNFLTELLIAKPYDVEYGIVENMKTIRYEVTNAKKSPVMALPESVYNRLKDILKKLGTGDGVKGLEKSFDYLTFEISRLKENFNENLESRFGQLTSETENISRKIDRKTGDLDSKLNDFKDKLDSRNSRISQEIGTSHSSPSELQGVANEIENMKKNLMNLQKVLEYFKDYTWVPSIDHKYYTWETSYIKKEIPYNAFIAGSDAKGESLYVGRAFYGGDLLPAKISPRQGASISFNGREITLPNYQILCGSGLLWEKFKDGKLPGNAVKAGYIEGQPKTHLYIGRTLHEGNMLPGKVDITKMSLFIAYDGKEHQKTDFEILVSRKNDD